MWIEDMDAYKRMEKEFKEKGYKEGRKLPMYNKYIDDYEYSRIKLKDVPEKARTRKFFLNALSSSYSELVEYCKKHPEKFDRDFFKDHISTNDYSLCFEQNDFEWMPLEFIDEELVMLAFLKPSRIDTFGDWFFSVHKRKPEVLTKDMYILGARRFASKKFLDITPEEYRTTEYYFALCSGSKTPIMEAIPNEVLTGDFLLDLFIDSRSNIESFSEKVLERKIKFEDDDRIFKVWEAFIYLDGRSIEFIQLNEERIAYFKSKYDKDSKEYRDYFKSRYKWYRQAQRRKNSPQKDNTGMLALALAMSGVDRNTALDIESDMTRLAADREDYLPIEPYCLYVPREYCKKYDETEYLAEIYKKIGVTIVEEADDYYYRVILPENLKIVDDENGRSLRENDQELIHIFDRGPFYDRSVYADKVNVAL